MSAAKIKTTSVGITISNINEYYYLAKIDKTVFDGYLKVYNAMDNSEQDPDDTDSVELTIPKVGDKLKKDKIMASEEYNKSLGRYSEANLVKKMEDLNIGRPSTFANIVAKILEREYVKKVDIAGT
jgi:DNA topoisomerase-1